MSKNTLTPEPVRLEHGITRFTSSVSSDTEAIDLLIRAIMYEERVMFKQLPVARQAVEEVRKYLKESKDINYTLGV